MKLYEWLKIENDEITIQNEQAVKAFKKEFVIKQMNKPKHINKSFESTRVHDSLYKSQDRSESPKRIKDSYKPPVSKTMPDTTKHNPDDDSFRQFVSYRKKMIDPYFDNLKADFRQFTLGNGKHNKRYDNHTSFKSYEVNHNASNNRLNNSQHLPQLNSSKSKAKPSKGKFSALTKKLKSIVIEQIQEMPLKYREYASSKLDYVNFNIYNSWYLQHGNNWVKLSRLGLRDKISTFKEIIASAAYLESEVLPIFKAMDADSNGYIDLKEYRLSRYLFDGSADKKSTKLQFKTMTSNNSNKLYYTSFKNNFKKYFEDVACILEIDLYSNKN